MKYILKGLGCANCAAKMEEKINKLNKNHKVLMILKKI